MRRDVLGGPNNNETCAIAQRDSEPGRKGQPSVTLHSSKFRLRNARAKVYEKCPTAVKEKFRTGSPSRKGGHDWPRGI
jgi:hypothetical protein